MRVVHRLEAIEIDHQQREALAIAALARQRRLDMAAQQQAVRQARQRIVMRHVDDLVGAALAFGDVGEGSHDSAARQRTGPDLQGDTVRTGAFIAADAVQISRLDGFPERQVNEFAVLAVLSGCQMVCNDVGVFRAQMGGIRQTQQFNGALVDEGDGVIRIDHHDALAHVIEGELQLQRFFLRHGLDGGKLLVRLLHSSAVTDIDQDDDQDEQRQAERNNAIEIAGAPIVAEDVLLGTPDPKHQRKAFHHPVEYQPRDAVDRSA
jgi:hypothetical protein